jgi:outer membrane lipoprotein-sorting protein
MLININLYEAKYKQEDIWVCLLKAIKSSLFLCIAIVIIVQLLSLRPAMADDIIKAEEWFNNLTTYQAKFTQIASDGSHKTGQFSLKRPHFSRFDYDDPDPLTLITTEAWLHVDEADRRQVTSYPINETPLALILNERVQLREGESEVETKSEIRDGVILITLEQHSGLAAGTVVLEFSREPFELRRWLITDSNGISTSIFLSEPKKGITLSQRLFVPTNYPAQN